MVKLPCLLSGAYSVYNRMRRIRRLLRDHEEREVLLEGLVQLEREGLHRAGRPPDGGVQRVQEEAVAGLEDAHGVPEGCTQRGGVISFKKSSAPPILYLQSD